MHKKIIASMRRFYKLSLLSIAKFQLSIKSRYIELSENINSKLKSPFSYKLIAPFFLFIILLSYFDLGIPDFLHHNDKEAITKINSIATNLITLFGTFISIGAIIFSIIQSQKQDEEITSIIFRESYLFPIIWFSAFSILVLTIINAFDSNSFLIGGSVPRFFVLFSVLFCTEVILIGFLFHRIYHLLTTDFLFKRYLDDYSKYATNEQLAKNDIKQKTRMRRVEQRFLRAIEDNDEDTYNSIFNVYKYINLQAANSKAMNSFWILIKESSYKLFESGKIEAIWRLYHLYFELLQEEDKLLNNTNFSIHLSISVDFLRAATTNELRSAVAIHLADYHRILIYQQYCDKFMKLDSKGAKIIANERLYVLLRSYSNLLRMCMLLKDINSFEKLVYRMQTFEDFNQRESSLDELKFMLFTKDAPPSDKTQINLTLDLLKTNYYLADNIFIIKFGFYSWTIDQYLRGIIDLARAAEIIKIINIDIEYDHWDVFRLFTAITEQDKLYDWSNWEWDEIEHKEGQVYYLEGTNRWIVFGFFTFVIQHDLIFYLLHENCWQYKKNITITSNLFRLLGDYKNNVVKISSFLNITSDDFTERLDKIGEILSNHSKIDLIDSIRAQSEEKIDSNKVAEFYEIQGNEWLINNIENVFSYYGNTEVIIDSEIKLKIAGINTNYIGGKMYFRKDYPSDAYKIFQLGNEIKSRTNKKFFTKLSSELPTRAFNNNEILFSLDKSINELHNHKNNPNIIFSNATLILTDNLLTSSAHFEKFIPINLTEYGFGLIGKYKGIPIFHAGKDFGKNNFLIADFNSLIKLVEKQNVSWFKNKLRIEVNEIDRDKAKEIFIKDPQKWNTHEGIKLNDEEAILNIMTGVSIKLERIIDFRFLNLSAGILLSCNEAQK